MPSGEDLALVVAAHGRDELAILRAGLEAGVRYVGLVASRKRGAAVLDILREEGVSDELLDRIDTPAGLDIGARSPSEIALSILARVIEERRRSGLRARAAAPPPEVTPITAIDPICGMTVVTCADTPSVERHGETYYFCCEGCKSAFEREHVA